MKAWLVNEIIMENTYDVNSPFPSVFKRIREVYPEAKLGSYCDWDPITTGIVEGNIGVSHDTARDVELTPVVCEYIKENKPDFLFIHFDSCDAAGHKNGYATPAFMEQIHKVDKLIGDIYSAIEEANMIEDTLLMLIADHGGANTEKGTGSHGGWTDGEKYVTFAAMGKGVNQTEIKTMNIRDLAAIVLYAMGIKSPDLDENGWTSQVPEDIFADADLPEYKDITLLKGAAPRISEAQHTSQLV